MFGFSEKEIAQEIEANGRSVLAHPDDTAAREALQRDAVKLASSADFSSSGVDTPRAELIDKVNQRLRQDGFPGYQVQSDGSIRIESADAVPNGSHRETQITGASEQVQNSRQVVATQRWTSVSDLNRDAVGHWACTRIR